MERNNELGSKRRTKLDPDLFVDVLGDAQIDEIQLTGLRGVGEGEGPGETHLDV